MGAFWLKWNEMQHFLKSQLFPTCSIRVTHAKWPCNILTFVPCVIWDHKCPACHNTHLHSSCKTVPFPGELTSLIHNSGWQGDRLTNVTELVSPELLHTWLDLLHPPTSPRDQEASPPVSKQMADNAMQPMPFPKRRKPGYQGIVPGRERVRGALMKSTGNTWALESKQPEFESWLFYLFITRLWTCYLTSLSLLGTLLSFPWKMELIMPIIQL